MGPFAPFDEVLGCQVCAWCCQVTPKHRTYVGKCRPSRNRVLFASLDYFGGNRRLASSLFVMIAVRELEVFS